MKLRLLLASSAILLAAITAQAGLLPVHPDSTDAADRSSVESHHALTDGCPGGDLHVMRYQPGEPGSGPLIATWCR